jgi:cell wall-associated NlpC family hydrolase
VSVSAGDAYLDVHGRLASGFGRKLAGQVNPVAGQIGEKAGHHFGRRFAHGVKLAAAAIGVGLAAATVVAVKGILSATKAASDLNETVNKTKVIFGSSKGEILRWSRGSATALGLSRQEALANAAAFGDMFLQLKIGRPRAVDMSKGMVRLAADFASFHNADITDVLAAQQSAFRGEYDALQRFVPGINAARVEQEALRATHKKSAKDLTLAEKAQATYNIMLRDGARATGDFARTSQDNANQQRIAKAQWADLKATIGQGFLPAQLAVTKVFTEKLLPAGAIIAKRMLPGIRTGVTSAATALAGAVPSAKRLAGGSKRLGEKLGTVIASLGKIPLAVKLVTGAYRDGDVTSSGFHGTLETVGVKARELVTAFQEARTSTGGFKDATDGLRDTVSVAGVGVGFLADHLGLLKLLLPALVAGFLAYKTAQALGNVAQLAHVALLPAQIAGNFALAGSNRALVAAQREQVGGQVAQTVAQTAGNTAGEVGILTSIRARVAAVAQAVASRVVAVATRAWAAGQWLLNTALTANPIGLVVAAVALLIAGLVLAYQHSDTFRRIVDTAFRAVAAAGKWMWEEVLKPAFDDIGLAFTAVGTAATFMWDKVLRPTFTFLVEAWLTVAGAIVHGAATAFGWVPGLGPKLKAAAEVFDTFRQSVTDALNKINGKDVKVNAKAGIIWTAEAAKFREAAGRMATGGRIPGYGGGDQVPILAERGEAVVDKVRTRRYAQVLGAMGVPGFARGGRVGDAGDQHQGVRVVPFGSVGPLERGVPQVSAAYAAVARGLGRAVQRALEKAISTGRVGKVLEFAMAQLGEPYRWGATGPNSWDCSGLMQRAFQAAGVTLPRVSRDQARVGEAVSRRMARLGDLIYFGSPAHHIGLYLGADRMLHAPHTGDHVRISGGRVGTGYRRVLDRGGWLQPGVNVVENRTGRPERVLPPGGGMIDYQELAKANAASFANALHGSKVELDGERVGELVVEPQFRELRRMLRGGSSR